MAIKDLASDLITKYYPSIGCDVWDGPRKPGTNDIHEELEITNNYLRDKLYNYRLNGGPNNISYKFEEYTKFFDRYENSMDYLYSSLRTIESYIFSGCIDKESAIKMIETVIADTAYIKLEERIDMIALQESYVTPLVTNDVGDGFIKENRINRLATILECLREFELAKKFRNCIEYIKVSYPLAPGTDASKLAGNHTSNDVEYPKVDDVEFKNLLGDNRCTIGDMLGEFASVLYTDGKEKPGVNILDVF